MTRKRRCNRPVQPNRLDQNVVMFAVVQESQDWKLWRFRSVSLRVALSMVEAGDAEALQIETENGLVTFYRETKAAHGGHSPATLTFATMNAVGIAERGVKLSRSEQAHVDKFLVWPEIGDTKAVAVRPRVSDRDQIRAAQAMDRVRGVRPVMAGRCHGGRSGEIRTLHIEPITAAA